MRERQPLSRERQKEHAAESVQRVPRKGRRQFRRYAVGFLLLIVLLSGVIFSWREILSPSQPPATQKTTSLLAQEAFHNYPFPRMDNQPMRPAIDHQGRIWFGAMGQNALVVFDPRTQAFHYLVPPHGQSGVMGVQVAPDDTIWFAEQFANYLGHYFPATGRYVLYPLPWLKVPDPAHTGQVDILPSAPNELVLDAHGVVWFTEFNADRLGRLDPVTGLIRSYPLAAHASIQTLFPYGITIDPSGMLWFTEAGTNHLGRLDPTTGAIRLLTAPSPQVLLMEIASDAQGTIWVTSFTPGLLFCLHPARGTFTSYLAPAQGSTRSTLYGLLVTPSGTVWVTMLEANAVARLDPTTQRFLLYPLPVSDTQPLGLVMDANQALWFTGIDAVGMVCPEKNNE